MTDQNVSPLKAWVQKNKRLIAILAIALVMLAMGIIPIIFIGWHPVMPQAYVLMFGAMIVSRIHPYSRTLISLVVDGSAWLGVTAILSLFVYHGLMAYQFDMLVGGSTIVALGVTVSMTIAYLRALELFPEPHWLMMPSFTVAGFAIALGSIPGFDLYRYDHLIAAAISLALLHASERWAMSGKAQEHLTLLMGWMDRWDESRRMRRIGF